VLIGMELVKQALVDLVAAAEMLRLPEYRLN
jgi:hypothetical protein